MMYRTQRMFFMFVLCAIGCSGVLWQRVIGSALDRVEIGTALARFPAVAVAHHLEKEDSKHAHVAALCADAVRVSNEVISLVNHNDHQSLYTVAWLTYDAIHSFKTLLTLFGWHRDEKLLSCDCDQADSYLKKFSSQLRLYILPLFEGVAATCVALYKHDLKYKRFIERVEALSSTSRLFSDSLAHSWETTEGKITRGLLVVNALLALYEFRDILAKTTIAPALTAHVRAQPEHAVEPVAAEDPAPRRLRRLGRSRAPISIFDLAGHVTEEGGQRRSLRVRERELIGESRS